VTATMGNRHHSVAR